MTSSGSSATVIATRETGLNDETDRLSARFIGFMEEHPAATFTTVALVVFGSICCTAIRAGWTPEQIVELGEAFPVQVSIPSLNL